MKTRLLALLDNQSLITASHWAVFGIGAASLTLAIAAATVGALAS
jgi:hypothetical protein